MVGGFSARRDGVRVKSQGKMNLVRGLRPVWMSMAGGRMLAEDPRCEGTGTRARWTEGWGKVKIGWDFLKDLFGGKKG